MVAIKLDLVTYFLNENFNIFIKENDPINYIALHTSYSNYTLVSISGNYKDEVTNKVYKAILNEIYDRYLETFCIVDITQIVDSVISKK